MSSPAWGARSSRTRNSNPPLPDAVRAFLGGEQDLVQVSGELAHALRDSQGGNSPAGLLLVASARLDGQQALLVVKLEHETGMQTNEIVTDGLRTFAMQYLDDLLLTQKSKVYKVALFSEEGLVEPGLQGWAADPQTSGKDVARFFLEKFLGCRHQNDPRELTRRFHDTAMNWVNSLRTDSDTRMNYVLATMVELQSPTPTLDTPRSSSAPTCATRTRPTLPHSSPRTTSLSAPSRRTPNSSATGSRR